jgi:hypothetical protein
VPWCSIATSSVVGTYTPTFDAQTNCECTPAASTCHSLYQAKAVSLAPDGWHSTIRFKKATGQTIPAGLSYWVAVGASPAPECGLLDAYVVHAWGTVIATGAEVEINDVPIWPDQATFDSDPVGATKNIFVITDGAGSVGQKTWFQKDALTFTKTCP